jgi:hypothetical protein
MSQKKKGVNFILLDNKYQVDLNSLIGSGKFGNVYLGYYYD